MEKNIIYLIFILAYLGYTYYHKSKIKNQKSKIKQINKPTNQQIKKSLLEKFLLGEEFFEPPKTADSDETDSDELRAKSQMPPASIPTFGIPASSSEQSVVNSQISDVRPQTSDLRTNKFNLRQAIIYSIILEKSYK